MFASSSAAYTQKAIEAWNFHAVAIRSGVQAHRVARPGAQKGLGGDDRDEIAQGRAREHIGRMMLARFDTGPAGSQTETDKAHVGRDAGTRRQIVVSDRLMRQASSVSIEPSDIASQRDT
jgi:hypothetical protein